MGKRKCICCDEWIENNEDSVPYKGRYAHQACFNIAMKALQKDKIEKLEEKTQKGQGKKRKTQPKAELQDSLSEQEYRDKQEYYQYLKEIVAPTLPAKIYVLSEEYRKKYGFTFKGMYNTLYFLKEIEEKKLLGDIVGIIPYYYNKADEYIQSIERVREKNKDKDINMMYQEKVIKIPTYKKKNRQIDITSV